MILKISLRAKAGVPKTLVKQKFRLYSLYFPQNKLMSTESRGEFSDLHSIFRLRALRYWASEQAWGHDSLILAKVFFGRGRCQVFFFGGGVFLNWDGVEVHKLAKKERDQYPAILTQKAWSINDLLFGSVSGKSCSREKASSPGRARWLHLAVVANHSAWFGSSCPLTELAMQQAWTVQILNDHSVKKLNTGISKPGIDGLNLFSLYFWCTVRSKLAFN